MLESERAMLQGRGHELTEVFRFSDEILNEGLKGTLKGALSTPWNPFSARKVRREVDNFLPDVVHVHNTFPLLSPSIFHSIGSRAARVLTLHNYRLFCPAAIPMRNGKVCTQCLDRQAVWPALKYGCYRNSRLATLPLALNVSLHRGLKTWANHVDAFIALTEFQREKVIEAGLPARLVHVKPNFYPEKPVVIPQNERKSCVVFAGRLTAEKGVESLIRAWLEWGREAPELRIVGDGNLRIALERLAASNPEVAVRFLGQLSSASVQQEIASAALLVSPSECFEGFPMVLAEAFALGTPVAVSKIGPLPSIVKEGENGAVFSPGDHLSLLRVVKQIWETEGALEKLAVGARQAFESKYTEQKNYHLLMDIYQNAMDVNRTRKG